MNNNFRGEELDDLFRKYANVHNNVCIACSSDSNSLWGSANLYKAYKCNECHLIWMSPALSEEGLSEYYSNYIGKRRVNNLEKMRLRMEQYVQDSSLIKKFISSGKLLDVGCNGGFFLNALGGTFDRYGVEIDEKAVEYAKNNFPDFGYNIDNVDLLTATEIKESSFDLITMRGVIEHVLYPEQYIKKVSLILKEKGFFYICATPNGGSISAEIFRDKWNLFHPVQHIWHFSPHNLSLICKRHGLELVWKEYPYLGTPYEDVLNDIRAIANALDIRDKSQAMPISPAFFENMMSLVFQKK